jgi:glyoxylase-like metal-dependent hydrolase (beta-lactamase superfamily II)
MHTAQTQFGPIKIIPGENRGRFPFCTSIFIDDDVKTIIDPGAGLKPLQELKDKIDIVVNTHYHFDHIAYNHLFERAKVFVNDKEAPCFRNRKNIGSLLGMEEVYGKKWVDGWLKRISDPHTEQSPYSPQNNHFWWLSTSKVDETYAWGDILDFGKTRMQVIGTPGHSLGFSCMYFPDYGIVYVADIDLTDFGPWYGGTDGDIDLFIKSCKNLEALDAKFFITGHEKGILGKQEFKAGLKTFLEKIDERDEKILSALKIPHTLEELTDKGLVYGKKFHVDEWLYMWEHIMIKKHVQRLVKNQKVLPGKDHTYILP